MEEQSTYIQQPPFFNDMSEEEKEIKSINDARPLMLLGDSVTTDHISPPELLNLIALQENTLWKGKSFKKILILMVLEEAITRSWSEGLLQISELKINY